MGVSLACFRPLATFFMTLIAGSACASVIYVNVAATGAVRDGKTWATAYRDPGAATYAMRPGDEVWMAEGVYGTASGTSSIFVRIGTSLYGGFAGHETTREQRDPKAHVTVIDSGNNLPLVTVQQGGGSDTVIDGFTLRNVYSESPWGAIIVINASPIISNNVFIRNSALEGGAITCQVGARPTIINNVFLRNTGGAVSCNASFPTIANNVFVENRVTRTQSTPGQGIALRNGSVATIVNNTFVNNDDAVWVDAVAPAGAQTSLIANNIVAFNDQGIVAARADAFAATLRTNCVFGNGTDYISVPDPTGADGNISMDPKFAGRQAGDWHIQPDSPCRDAGNTSLAQSGSVDMDGQPRVQDGGVDIGADESDGTFSPDRGPVLHVRPDGNDSADGRTWQDAKRTVASALLSAMQGNEVWIAEGVYGGGIAPNGVSLYGGFAGTEAIRSQRDVATRVTMLEGDGAQPVLTVQGGANPVPAEVDGFTIRGGSVGIAVKAGSVALRHGMITENGAGIAVSLGTAIVEDCTITRNTGTGVSGTGSHFAQRQSVITLRRCTISGNRATNGGAFNIAGVDLTVEGCRITRNSGKLGGALYAQSGSDGQNHMRVAGNTFRDNTAEDGAVFFQQAYDARDSNRFANNMIIGNGASAGSIISWSAPADVVNNTIVANFSGGKPTVELSWSVQSLTNNILAFNSAGILRNPLTSKPLTLRNNCVFGNTALAYQGFPDPTGTNGNISVDPLLAGTSLGDVHILPHSPCLDAGDDSVIEAGDDDADGQSRVHGAHVDIGADESDGSGVAAVPRILHVRPDGNDAADGLTWNAAKRTVQAALDTAGGGEVWVAAGTYDENISVNAFTSLHGGFSGMEMEREQRDPATNRTILDGGEHGPVVVLKSGYQVSAVDGFTIENGVPDASEPAYLPRGAGVSATTAAGSIANNVVTGNKGIGIAALWGSIISNNIVSDNIGSGEGAGITTGAGSVVRNNVVRDNFAPVNGGGVVIRGAEGSVEVANNTIIRNGAGSGGGVWVRFSGTANFVNNIIAFNSDGVAAAPPVGFPTPPAPTLDFRDNCFFNNGGSHVSGTPDPIGANGNFIADPLLVDVDYGDAHIQPASPCMDAGDASVVRAGESDVDGQPRVQGEGVDIGADESDGTLWPVPPRVVVRVSPAGDDGADGSSWPLAKRTIQAAMDATAARGHGEVWVASGNYLEHLALRSHVSVYGGFQPGNTTRGQRNWTLNRTVLDGGGSGPVAVADSVINAGLDGFTVTNGLNASVGGIAVTASWPRIEHNVITGNRGAAAGGISCIGDLSQIANNIIADNAAYGNQTTKAAGILCLMSSGAKILNNTIVSNRLGAGSVWLDGSAVASMTNNIVAFNAGGGVRTAMHAPLPIVRNNNVYGNAQYDWSSALNHGYDPTGHDGNLRADPLFVYGAGGDYRLTSASSSIDAGNDTVVSVGDLDMTGAARLFGSHVDMGAYEFSETAPLTMADVASALRMAGGLAAAPADLGRWDVAPAESVDILDAVRLAGTVAGRETKP